MKPPGRPEANARSAKPEGTPASGSSGDAPDPPAGDRAARQRAAPGPAPRHAPDKAQIAALPPFERLGLDRIASVSTAAEAERAVAALDAFDALGFDTESKPTFAKGEVSTGPHVLQFASDDRAWIVQLHDPACAAVFAAWMAASGSAKVGFGLRDDLKRIRERLGVEPRGVVDLNHVLRARGYRKDLGVKAAVAVLFGRRFAKSGRASTSNWAALRLSESQRLYAANDAWAALRVWRALAMAP